MAPESKGATGANPERVDLGGEEEMVVVNDDDPKAEEEPPTRKVETGDVSGLDAAGYREERLTQEVEAEADDLQAQLE